jgi:phosphohistidine phosphatase SixA
MMLGPAVKRFSVLLRHESKYTIRRFALLPIALLSLPVAAQANAEAAWSALKQGGHVLLLRHTETAPGIGDPPGYRLDDCKTQRNLSTAGRAQARAWGKAFADNGIQTSGVFSSVWCRCVDTAVLAFGKADTWPALNSHFDSGSGDLQAQQVRGGLTARMKPGKTLVLVTHQVNITELTGRTPAMGEAVVARVAHSTDLSQPPQLDIVGMLKLP